MNRMKKYMSEIVRFALDKLKGVTQVVILAIGVMVIRKKLVVMQLGK